ncbi:hypothetical protein A3F06_01735 [candidate division TM6 bacterium RIFCSPHIGHO2_12_FULL_36_22]|nr:MAG: hypothetical protein A3F06_01735 [candidate division TM6 bacterium RIFCSPHIGHO2_12_FULL_36_22]
MLEQFNTFLTKELNAEQKKAVTQTTGNLLVIAGAGSGKTRVITARITNLILNENVDPSRIAALTFTNKAAKEMKERIKKFLGSDTRLPFIGTFHSYCLQWLKIVYPTSFSIMDSDDQYKILSQIITRNNLKKFITARQATYHVSNLKNQIICGIDTSTMDSTLLEIYKQYEAEKAVSNCLDFDDLLIEVLRLFRNNAAFKTQFQERISHILIDEYQDTSVVQHELLKQMAKNDKTVIADSVCIVGDEDQSIYSWRGATIDNIINFKKDFPSTKTIKIEQNYRSVQQILDTAHSVIEKNIKRNPKKLWSEKKGTNRVHQLSCASGYQEADSIAWLLQSLPQEISLNKVAILYRTHFQSRSIEEALIKYSIPYTIIGGIQFYERKEIKDLIAYLRLLVNPFDRIALMRIINCPKRGLGQKFEEELVEFWNSQPLLDFKQILDEVSKKQSPSKQEAIKNFLGIFHGLTPDMAPDEALDKIIKRSMYHFYLKEEYDTKEAETKIDNTHEFIRAAEHFVQQGLNSIFQMLNEIALMQEKMTKDSEKSAQVQLMTLHAAKGLEFHTVVIAGVEETLLPSTRSLESMDDIEEERRLCYVGITRAEEYLFLTYAGYRNTYGQTNYQEPSRFLKDISPSLITRHDCAYWKEWEFYDLFEKLWGTKKNSESTIQVFKAHQSVNKNSFDSQTTLSNFIKTSQKASDSFNTTPWKKNQIVQHNKFGVGIIQKVDMAKDVYNLTIKFKVGIKKIASSFVTII